MIKVVAKAGLHHLQNPGLKARTIIVLTSYTFLSKTQA